MASSTINRGTGAGGAKTNLHGKRFEETTSNEQRLIDAGFLRKEIHSKGKSTSKQSHYFYKTFGADIEVFYMKQRALRFYMDCVHGKTLPYDPDEAYLIRNGSTYTLKIVEVKFQSVSGSVDIKLCAGGFFTRAYKKALGPEFNVEYTFCVNRFLQDQYTNQSQKFTLMRAIHEEDNVRVLFGDDEDYFAKLDQWLALPVTSCE